MARRTNRPGRTLIVFFAVVVLSYVLVAFTASWKPTLGLDLQGGTQITLQAEGNPGAESLNEARAIIDQRVNGSGVSEAEVTTQGGDQVVVEIPGDNQRSLEETVKRQAQLRFRLVACSDFQPCAGSTAGQQPTAPSPVEPPTAGNGGDGGNDNGTGGNGKGKGAGTGSGGSGSGDSSANRPPVGFSDSQPAAPRGSASPSEAASASPSDSASASPSGDASQAPASSDPNGVVDVEEALAFQNDPPADAVAEFDQYSCRPDGVLLDADGNPTRLPDDSLQPLVACSEPEGNPDDPQYQPAGLYLLSPAVIQGTSLDSASPGLPQGSLQWVVQLQIGGAATDVFAEISRQLVGSQQQFAIVLDGSVISAPTMQGVIPDGTAQISGNFTESSATALSTSLRYGALPIAFGNDPQVIDIGPTLAGNQLSAGVSAGLVGLLLVMIYCLFYYRGLGLVILTSLVVAAGVTYSMVLLLSEAAGFTLTLPGIAGLIVAVGITADSFIVFFERIRDEMREGKSMRVAVEAGWARARNTCLAADAVSLLAAVVLYIFAAGVVRGFAFALGLSTLIDLAVFFWFTKPTVSVLARYRFFSSGHRFSGLSASTLGVDEITASRSDSPREKPSGRRDKIGGRA